MKNAAARDTYFIEAMDSSYLVHDHFSLTPEGRRCAWERAAKLASTLARRNVPGACVRVTEMHKGLPGKVFAMWPGTPEWAKALALVAKAA